MAKPLELGDDEIRLFGIDWTALLSPDDVTGLPTDSVATSNWVVPDELTEVSSLTDGVKSTVKLDGSAGVIGTVYEVTNIVTTSVSTETLERTLRIKVVEAKYK
jgi:hypothetical protein